MVVEPNGIHPITSKKFRALVMMKAKIKNMIKGIHAANFAGVTRWVGFHFEKQPYKLRDKCKVPDHNTRLCGDRKTQKINMERTVRNFGPALEPVILPQKNPQELANLFMQHSPAWSFRWNAYIILYCYRILV